MGVTTFRDRAATDVSSVSRITTGCTVGGFSGRRLVRLGRGEGCLVRRLTSAPLGVSMRPKNTFCLFPEISSILKGDVCKRSVSSIRTLYTSLLRERRITVAPKSFFSTPGGIHVSCTGSVRRVYSTTRQVGGCFGRNVG